jgi:tRNA A37 N6-isopentenylltransferase MiaA
LSTFRPDTLPQLTAFLRDLDARDGNHAFLGLHQRLERVVAAAQHAADERRLERHHGVPRHRHRVRLSAVRRRNQHHGAGLQQAVHFAKAQCFHNRFDPTRRTRVRVEFQVRRWISG